MDADEYAASVYTTRCDTLFGVTFMVIAPEHPLFGQIPRDRITNMAALDAIQG